MGYVNASRMKAKPTRPQRDNALGLARSPCITSTQIDTAPWAWVRMSSSASGGNGAVFLLLLKNGKIGISEERAFFCYQN